MKKQEEAFFGIVETQLGAMGLIWAYEKGKRIVKRIYLPAAAKQIASSIKADYPHAMSGSKKDAAALEDMLRRYINGEDVDSLYESLDLAVCNEFQKKVLLCDRRIPRGMVSTYSGLAARAGSPKAARAVGSAQAGNPFPLIIPCHRVIRSDGTLGGFGGGLKLKRKLLEMEGVAFDEAGRVRPECIWR